MPWSVAVFDKSGEHEVCVDIVKVVISCVAEMRAMHRIEHNNGRSCVS